MPGVNPVQPRVQGGLLDSVLKGMQVARDVYGIKHDMAATDQAEQQTDMQAQGIQPASEKINAMRFGRQVPEGTEGATKMQFAGDPGPLYMQAIKDTAPQKTVFDALIDGKHGTATYDQTATDPNNPKAGLVGFVETAKPDKPVNSHFAMAPVTDQNGSPIVYDTTTGAAKAMDTGGLNLVNPKADATAKKASDAEEKTYTEMVGKINNPGRNRAVQTAQLNLLNIANAQELIKKYPDLNQMPPQQVALLNAELSKISSGGVGSQHGQEAQAANTLQERWAKLKQTVGGEPTGADVGLFIQQNKDYLDGLQNVSQKRVDDYGREMYSSYKHRLSPELQKRFETEHGDLFGGGHQPAQTHMPVAQGGGFVGTANAGPQLAPTKSGYMPGTVIEHKGAQYTVGADGDTLTPVGAK